MSVLGFRFEQVQTPKETRPVIHLLAQTGEAYCVPDLYDLRPIPEGHDRVVMLDRAVSGGVELWRGPAPLARDLIHAIIHAVERASSGDVIDVAALAAKIQGGEP